MPFDNEGNLFKKDGSLGGMLLTVDENAFLVDQRHFAGASVVGRPSVADCRR
jgi:hypothetical protein